MCTFEQTCSDGVRKVHAVSMQARADDHAGLRAELAVLTRERTRLETEPASLGEHKAYFARLSDLYVRLDAYFQQTDERIPVSSRRKRSVR